MKKTIAVSPVGNRESYTDPRIQAEVGKVLREIIDGLETAPLSEQDKGTVLDVIIKVNRRRSHLRS